MKRYSWMSYGSLGIPIMLLLLLLAVPGIAQETLVKAIYYALFLGAPLSVILSAAALIRKKEKNGPAVLGLIASLLLTGSLIYVIMLSFGIGEA